MSTGLILLAPSFLGVLNFEPVPDMMRRLTLCNSSFQKKKSLLKLSEILSSSPALWVFAGDDLLCSGNYCRCSGVSKGAKAKDRALVLPGIC